MNMISELRQRVRKYGTATITAEDYDQLQAEWITRAGISTPSAESAWRQAMYAYLKTDEVSGSEEDFALAMYNAGLEAGLAVKPDGETMPTGAKLRCRKCGNETEMTFQYASTPSAESAPLCGAPAVGGPCVLPEGHNMGNLDIPSRHQAAPATPPSESDQSEFERGRQAGITQVYDSFLAKQPITIPEARVIESEFKREPRYIVFKITDIEKYLPEQARIRLGEIGNWLAYSRKMDGKPPFNAVVVEQDWPEFEPTWAAIEARVAREATGGKHE